MRNSILFPRRGDRTDPVERAEPVPGPTIREQQLNEAQALAHVGSRTWEAATDSATWSDEHYRICGIPIGRRVTFETFLACVHPEDRQRVENAISEAIGARCPAVGNEFRIVRPSGEIRFVQNRHIIEFDGDGKPARMIGTLLDITDRCRAEEAVALSERRHRELVENASDIVTVIDGAGVVQYMSPSVQRLLGYSTGELLGHSVVELIHVEDRALVLDAIRRDLEAPGVPNKVEFRFRHHDGMWRVLEAIGQAREESSGVFSIVVNSRDITDRKEDEGRLRAALTALEAARTAAESATRAKSQFLASMSHEIRTPMNAVLGLTEVVLESELTPEQRRYLEMVRNSGDVLLTLLNDILDLSKIEADRLEIESIPLDIAALVHSTAGLFANTARERGLDLRVEIGPDIPRYVNGDPTRLRQVITNLVGNAVKFTHVGMIVVSATCTRTVNGDAMLHVSVRDTGIGIAADKLGTLFTTFNQLDASTTRQYGGTGLGLAIAKRLIQLMDGELTVWSEPEKGSEFAFTLRLPVANAPEFQPAAAPVRLSGTRVLVVDDLAVNRRLVRGILEQAGAIVFEAPSVTDALRELERGYADGMPYNVVLLDSQMPDRDGWSLAQEIHRSTHFMRTHMLMLTSTGQRGDAARCRDLGIEGYLTKPASRSDLMTAIAAIVGGKRDGILTRHTLTEARTHLRVLLAEDNFVNQEVVLAMLGTRGHAVTVVDDGEKAVAAVVGGAFDIVLMDLHMPVMDGFAATAAIRKLPGCADLRIVALTADALVGERERCLNAGMDGYLAKPFTGNDLYAVVEGGDPPQGASARGLIVTPMAMKAIAEAPPVDIEAFRASMRGVGAEAAVDRILDTFLSDAPRRRDALEAALASNDAARIREAAHAFKSAAGCIGARTLAARLLEVERAGAEARLEDARSLGSTVRSLASAAMDCVCNARNRETTK